MSKPVLPEDVMTADEAAKFLRVSKATVLRQAQKGLLIGTRIGRQWRFLKQELMHTSKVKI